MADTGAKKGKKKKGKGKTLNLTEFLAGDGKPPPLLQQVKKVDWADDPEEGDDDLGDVRTQPNFDRSKLPTAPRSAREADIDLSKLPKSPPYTAFIGNLPFEVSDEEIRSFFNGLKIVNIRLIQEGGKQRGFGYAEFADLTSLKEALALHNNPMGSRKLRVDIADNAGHNQTDGPPRREESREEKVSDWRSGGDLPPPSGRMNGYSDGDRYGGRGDRGFREGFSRDGDRGFRDGDRGGFRDGDRGGFRDGDRGGFRDGDRGGFRDGDRGGFRRYEDRGQDRGNFGDRDRGGRDGGFDRFDRGGRGRPGPERSEADGADSWRRGPEPGSRGPEPGSRGPEPGSRGPEPGSRGPEPGSRGPEPVSRGPEPVSRGPEPWSRGPEPGSSGPEPGSRGPEPGSRGPEPGSRGPEPGSRGPEPGSRDGESAWRREPAGWGRADPIDRDDRRGRSQDGGRGDFEEGRGVSTWRSGGSRQNRDFEEQAPQGEPQRERKRLNLQPRSVPVDTQKKDEFSASSIFGGARPVDTAAREREIEARLTKGDTSTAVSGQAWGRDGGRSYPGVVEETAEKGDEVWRDDGFRKDKTRVMRPDLLSEEERSPRDRTVSTGSERSGDDAEDRPGRVILRKSLSRESKDDEDGVTVSKEGRARSGSGGRGMRAGPRGGMASRGRGSPPGKAVPAKKKDKQSDIGKYEEPPPPNFGKQSIYSILANDDDGGDEESDDNNQEN